LEAHMLVNGDIVLVVRFEIDGKVAAQLVHDAVQPALTASLGRDAYVLDIAVHPRIVILFGDGLGEFEILSRKTQGTRPRRGKEGERDERIAEHPAGIVILVSGTLHRGGCEEVLVHPRVVSGSVDL